MGIFAHTSELLLFSRGPQRWAYTFGSRPVVYDSQTFTPVRGMKRVNFKRTGSPDQASLQVTVPIDMEIVGLYIPAPTTQSVSMQLLWLRDGDATARLRWSGRVGGIKVSSATQAVIQGQDDGVDLSALGIDRPWCRQCPHVLGSAGLGLCNANMDLRRLDGMVTESSGVTLKAAAWATRDDGDFTGGYITWNIGVVTEQRMVIDHEGDTLTLLTPASIPPGTPVAAYSGCDHTDGPGGCAKYENNPNYGGQKWIPLKNPQGNNRIF